MIQKFIATFDANRARLLELFSNEHPASYGVIVTTVIQMLEDALSTDDYTRPDASRITTIDHGDYQGTMLFIIGATGYQRSNFWYVKVGYGSCALCDTMQGIRDNSVSEYGSDGERIDKPTARQANSYLTLALHVVQGLRPMQEDI